MTGSSVDQIENARLRELLESNRAQTEHLIAKCDHLQWRLHRLAENLAAEAPSGLNLVEHLHRQIAFSSRTFGPARGVGGVLDHLRKELIEIERKPEDLEEWIDVVLLALDGAWRSGHSAEAIASALLWKQLKNEGRSWPDWRTAEPGKAIEHHREATPKPGPPQWCDVCPHPLGLHNPDGTCGCGTDCVLIRSQRTTPATG